MESIDQTCIIIGAGHAGVTCAFALRNEGWQGRIVLIDSDTQIPYHRPPLSKSYLTIDDGSENNLLFPIDYYESKDIELKLGILVRSIDRVKKRLMLGNDSELEYDKLVLATGARPLIPPIDGIDNAENLFVLRTTTDATNIRNALKASEKKRVVIIGGGYVGLETAASLKSIGANVVVLEREARVLARVTGAEVSEFVQNYHKEKGVEIVTNSNVASIETISGNNRIFCVDGASFIADVIVLGVGIRVNLELALEAGLVINNGIGVNESTKTSDAHIYAIGDCTNHFNQHYKRNVRLESVQNAVDQANIAAKAICGQEVHYNAIPWFWSEQYDLKLQMVGLSEGYDTLIVRKEESNKKSLSVWYFKNDKLLAVDAINNARAYMLGTRIIKNGKRIDKKKLVNTSIPIKPTSFLN